MKPFKVVCINDDGWETYDPSYKGGFTHPEYNEIYKVAETYLSNGDLYYVLDGFPGRGYNSQWFRIVDNSYGEVVCETIEEQIKYEEAISV